MCGKQHDPETLAALGFKLSDFTDKEVVVWAEHWQAIELFCQIGTQWRMGFGGAVGLDYAVLFHLMNLQGIEKTRQLEILAQIQVCETAALDIFYRDKS